MSKSPFLHTPKFLRVLCTSYICKITHFCIINRSLMYLGFGKTKVKRQSPDSYQYSSSVIHHLILLFIYFLLTDIKKIFPTTNPLILYLHPTRSYNSYGDFSLLTPYRETSWQLPCKLGGWGIACMSVLVSSLVTN